MFPMSTFVAWSSRLNGSTGVETDSKIRLSQQMVFGMQDITISFQDRAMVSFKWKRNQKVSGRLYLQKVYGLRNRMCDKLCTGD